MANLSKVFTSKDKLTAEALNAALRPIYAELEAVKAKRADYEAQITRFNSEGIKRVAEAIKPLVDQLSAAIDGGLLVAQTDDLVAIVEGEEITFLIPEAARAAFRPTPFLAIMAPDEPEDWALAQKLTYNDNTGMLTVDVLYVNGSGAERTGWTVAASSGVVEAVGNWVVEIRTKHTEVLAAAEATQAAAILIEGGPVSSIDGETGAVTGIARTINHYTNAAVDALLALKADAAAMATALADKVNVNAVLTGFLGLAPAANDFLQWKSGAWANRTPAQAKTDLGISSFAETLLDDTSQAAMQATLGMRLVQIGPKQTVPAGGVQAVVFTSIPASGFSKFILVGIDVASEQAANTSTLHVQVSTDNGATFKTTSGDYYTNGANAAIYLTRATVPGASSTFQHSYFALELHGLGNPSRATSGAKVLSTAGISTTNISTSVGADSDIAMRVAVEADNAFRCVIASGQDIAAGSIFILYGLVEA